MNELQLWFTALGVVVLVAVIAWSLRQRVRHAVESQFTRLLHSVRRSGTPGIHQRRKRPAHTETRLARMESFLRGVTRRSDHGEGPMLGPDPSLIAGKSSEPTLPAPERPPDPAPSRHAAPEPPVLSDSVGVSRSVDAPEPTEALPRDDEPEDFRDVDFYVTIHGGDPVSRDDALRVYRQYEYELSKPHRIYGRQGPGAPWRNLEREPGEGMYENLVVSLQLADREGPVSGSDLTKFSTMVLGIGEALGRPFRFNVSVEDAEGLAAELDAFCGDFDLLAVLNVLPAAGRVFTGPAVDRCARQCDLEFGHRNLYHRLSPHGAGSPRWYALANLERPGTFDHTRLNEFSTRGLTFFFRIPITWRPAEAFSDMAQTAQALADCLGGELVDQNNQYLDTDDIAGIHEEIALYAGRMLEGGVVPGGPLSARLF